MVAYRIYCVNDLFISGKQPENLRSRLKKYLQLTGNFTESAVTITESCSQWQR